MFFVGSKVSEDIKHCLLMAFKDNSSIRSEIWKMFVIHELTHKMMNNQFNNYDQITGEEISLSSTIYSNPYLGLIGNVQLSELREDESAQNGSDELYYIYF